MLLRYRDETKPAVYCPRCLLLVGAQDWNTAAVPIGTPPEPTHAETAASCCGRTSGRGLGRADDVVDGAGIHDAGRGVPALGASWSVTKFGYQLGQSIFTPGDLNATQPLKNDRPYAGWLYTGLQIRFVEVLDREGG